MNCVLTISDSFNFTPNDNNALYSLVCQLLENESNSYVSNVQTKVAALINGDNAWAITINNAEYSNALICSPYTTYVTYPLGELKKFNIGIKAVVLLNTLCMSLLCRLTQFNKVVQVNNNLNSLIKHPKQFADILPSLTKKLTKKYPKHAITFYRVNDALDVDLLNALKNSGYYVFPDRGVHVFFPESGFMRRGHVKRDIALLRKSTHKIVSHDELTAEDAERFAQLYKQLFIDKHSKRNPIYTEKYFRAAIVNRWHEYVALRNESGKIDAFISWFDVENIMVCGPLGYDFEVDRKAGLYRQLVALCLQRSHEKNTVFNMGGGSDVFKKNRGSTETLEYVAVYCDHLPFYRKIPWKILHWACHKMIKKIMQSSDL